MVTVNFNMNAMATITITHVRSHIVEIGIEKNSVIELPGPYLRFTVIAFDLFCTVLTIKTSMICGSGEQQSLCHDDIPSVKSAIQVNQKDLHKSTI